MSVRSDNLSAALQLTLHSCMFQLSFKGAAGQTGPVQMTEQSNVVGHI